MNPRLLDCRSVDHFVPVHVCLELQGFGGQVDA